MTLHIPSLFTRVPTTSSSNLDPRGAKAHEDRRQTTGGGSQLVHATNLPHAANDLGEFHPKSCEIQVKWGFP